MAKGSLVEKASLWVRIRRQIGHILIRNVVEFVSRFARWIPAYKPKSFGLEELRNIAYLPSGKKEHQLDVIRPLKREGLLPVVFFVHGGAFRLFSKNTHALMAQKYATQGFVVFNINYRLSPKHRYPEGIQDVFQAVLWVQKHAEEYGGDNQKIVLAGESAGANLITCLALASCERLKEDWAQAVYDADLQLKAIMPACGLYQVTDVYRMTRSQKWPLWIQDRIHGMGDDNYLQKEDEQAIGKYELADVIVYLESTKPLSRSFPPIFTLCGTEDPVLEDTQRLQAAAEKRGIPCEVKYYKGGHVFHYMLWKKEAQQSWEDQYSYLKKHFHPSL